MPAGGGGGGWREYGGGGGEYGGGEYGGGGAESALPGAGLAGLSWCKPARASAASLSSAVGPGKVVLSCETLVKSRAVLIGAALTNNANARTKRTMNDLNCMVELGWDGILYVILGQEVKDSSVKKKR